MVQILQSRPERPSAIVCIAYRQLSTMTGIKDPTELPKVEKIEEEKQVNTIVKKTFTDFTSICVQDFIELSKDMAELFRTMLDNLKVRLEQFREQNRSILDLFSLSHFQNWSQREQ